MDLPPPPPALEQAEAKTPDLALFESACMNGRAELKPGTANKVSFSELPRGARRLLRFAMLPGADEITDTSPLLSSNQVPNFVYRLRFRREAYLIVPNQSTDTQFSGVCAVIMKGHRFQEARRLILPGPNRPVKLPAHQLPYVSTLAGGYRLTAAQHNGWTIASTVPE